MALPRNHFAGQLVRSWTPCLVLHLLLSPSSLLILAQTETISLHSNLFENRSALWLEVEREDLEVTNGQIGQAPLDITTHQLQSLSFSKLDSTYSGSLQNATDKYEEVDGSGEGSTSTTTTTLPFSINKHTSSLNNLTRHENVDSLPACAKNERRYGPDGNVSVAWAELSDGTTSCQCDQGFVRSTEVSAFSGCFCPASKILTRDEKCQEANRVYHCVVGLLMPDPPSLIQWNDPSQNPSLESMDFTSFTQPVEKALNDYLKGKNVSCQVSCQRWASFNKRSTASGQEADITKILSTNCFFKFQAEPEFLHNIPKEGEVTSLLRINSSIISSAEISVSEYDYCAHNEHNCDLQTTTCSFQPSRGYIDCLCWTFHSRINALKCLFDQNATLSHLKDVISRQSDLWIALYVFIGLFTVAFIALMATLLILQARPAKSKSKQSDGWTARTALSDYSNKLPRPTLAVTDLQHNNNDQSYRSNSILSTTSGPLTLPSNSPLDQDFANGSGSADQLPASSPFTDCYIPSGYRTSTHDTTTNNNGHTPQMALPQEMATFKRAHRPGQLVLNKRQSRPPLASSESSMERPPLSGSGRGNLSRPASRMMSTPGLMNGLDEGSARRDRISGEGAFFSMDDSVAVYQAIQQHRHSALLNLIQNQKDSTPQSNV